MQDQGSYSITALLTKMGCVAVGSVTLKQTYSVNILVKTCWPQSKCTVVLLSP